MAKKKNVNVTDKNEFPLEVVSIRLVKDAAIFSDHPLKSPEEVAGVLGEYMCQFDREVIAVVNLKANLIPINVHFASVGALDAAMAHPREFFKASILSNASSILLMHCHPSGNLMPSKEDSMLTDRMVNLCDLMGIPLTDHIIVGGDNREFFSFKEKGIIPNPHVSLKTDYRSIDFKPSKVAEQGKAR